MRRRVVVEDPAVESIDIAATSAKVWNLLTRVTTIPTWYDGWDSVQVPPAAADELEVGLTFVLEARRFGRRSEATCRVTELVQGHSISWVESVDRGRLVLVRFDLLDEGANLTRVQLTRASLGTAFTRSETTPSAP